MTFKYTLRATLFAVLLTIANTTLFAQVSGYAFTQSTSTYAPITGTNLGTGGWDDNNYLNIPLGFTFNFNGINYTTCNVQSNGYVMLGGTVPVSTGGNPTQYVPVSATTTYEGAIAAFGFDLYSSATNTRISYTTSGTAPNRIFIVQWNNARRFNYTGDVLNFQVRLYETSNVAEVRYGTCTATSATNEDVQVGLRGATNADFNNRSTTTNWAATTAGAANNATCRTRNTLMPASGLTFTWTPPPPVTINTTGMHPAASNLTQNTTDNLIGAYQVVTGSTALTPSAFRFNTAGTYTAATDITNFKLYQNTTNSLSGATLVATLAAPATGGLLNFNTGFSALAANSTAYFLVATDVPLSAQAGKTVSLTSTALTNFQFTGAVLRTGDNSPALVTNTHTIIGAQAAIAAVHPAAGTINQNSNVNPIAAYQVTASNGDVTPTAFTFTTAGTYANAADVSGYSLYQNSTNSLTGATLIGNIAGGTRPQTLTFNTGFSSITDGTTTYFILTADVPLTGTNGNTVNIAATNLNNFSFTTAGGAGVGKTGTNPVPAGNTQTIVGPVVTINAAHPAAGTVLQNTANNMLASYQVTVANADVNPTSFTFTTAGTYIPTTDITTFRLYMNNANNFASPTLIGVATASGNPQTLTFNTGFFTLAAGSTTYFIITADIALTSINGDNVNIAANSLANFSFTSVPGGTVAVTGATNPVAAGNTKTIYGPSVAITASQPPAANISLGSINNIIASYQLDVINAVSVTPTSATFTTAGSYVAGDLVNFKLYQNTAVTLTGATLVGTATAPASGGTITFNSGFLSIPSAGTSYLIITTDVGTGASALTHQVRLTSTSLSNLGFTGFGGGGVQKTGTNPATQGNLFTIIDPQVAITTVHPVAGSILTGSQNNLIASLRLAAANAPILPTGVTFTTAGTFQGSNDISIFNLYQNTGNSLTGATLVGTVTISGTSSANTLTYSGGFTPIAAGTNNFLLLVADVAGTATAGRTVNITTTPRANFSFSSTGPVTVSGADPLGAPAAPGQTIVAKLDVYWSSTTSPASWNGTLVNWGQNTGGGPTTPAYQNSVWINSGYGQFEGTAGQVNVTALVNARRLISTVNNYRIDASSSLNGITLTSPAEVTVNTGTSYLGGTTNTNPLIYGNNGLTKLGNGELQLGAPFGTGFGGNIFGNAGELTIGRKTGATSQPTNFLQNNPIEIDNSIFTIAASSGGAGSLRQMPSFTASGASTISLYQTPSFSWMNVIPSTNSASAVAGTYVPLSVSGQLTVNRGTSTSVTGLLGANALSQNMIAFGSATLTGNTTFVGYSTGNWATSNGDMININLGGYGHYFTGVSVATGTINDNGYSMTILGGGNTNYDGAALCLNASGSTMTGNWILGDAAGTNAGWLVTNTSTCLTRGSVTVNNFSKLCLQLTSNSNVNITYSPSVINLYGLGPANQAFPAALDLFNFSGSAGITTLPSDIVLTPVYNSKLASIGSQVGTTNTTTSFILSGRLSGTGGLEKTGPGIIVLNTQNISGNYNTYQDTTRVRNGTLTVNAGSNLGTGPLHMYQLDGRNTTVNLLNTAQTVAALSTTWTNNSGQSQVVNLSGTVLTVNQNVNTIFGNGTGTSTGYIAGTGSLVKTGTGTLTLTGPCTYTGYTQVKNGTLQLNKTGGNTLPVTADVHIIGGKLKVSTSQELDNLVLSTGTLEVDNGVVLTISGTFTMVPTSASINLIGTGRIVYTSTGTLNYGGNVQQVTSAKELPATGAPRNIVFNNYSAQGVQLSANVSLAGTASVGGWLDYNSRTVGGTGTFVLNGLNSKTPKGTTTAGSNYLTNLVFTGSLEIGMQVSGAGIPANSYIIFIDPLVPNSVTINNNATASAGNITFDMSMRGGLMVNLAGGIDAHVVVSGARTYNSGANYIFKTPNTGVQIYPAFPTVGTLNYSPAYDVSIQAGLLNRVVMGNAHDLEVAHDLNLASGIFVTNNNLITWSNSGGVLATPEATYTANATNYTNSFIATCDLAGVPLNVAGATSAFSGAKGFRIKNIANTDTYFPVGASYLTAGTAITTPSPNRMMINNQSGTPHDYTVVVNYGDIGYTYGGAGSWRVNRIWYVKSSGATGKATMRLFFTKRNWINWGAGENEVEAGFVYAKPALVQKDYSVGNGNFLNLSDLADITDFTGNANNTEIYGQYTIGISNSLTNGVEQFNRFSVVNPDAIILPVTVINLKASQAGDKIRVDWTALNETGVDHYEIEKSVNAATFTTIGSVKAYNNNNPRNDYSFDDMNPVSGKNYYRIKTFDKDGRTATTIIVVVSVDNGKVSVSVTPNPVKNKTMVVTLNNLPAGRYEAVMYSTNGEKVYQRVIEHIGGSVSQTLNLPATLSSGAYVLRVLNHAAGYTTKIFVE
ncbi:autotransporter-associated beta strand repeat-containing protein [Panacibacter sp. DH6]|uniref:Autotransporter-associated beta strand repeat-containing protein n=1 Tax=Panacibacter microcysteis TaxID=2793269 RepID=A0A931E830_9BACT|nr:autotransporter-associated beta strand repeat-containing protein [Panacibacter microcysteis]MBG9376879.1 autotransporter-associated beta strand repeat-containing protein [Panacibacter microcysteis]